MIHIIKENHPQNLGNLLQLKFQIVFLNADPVLGLFLLDLKSQCIISTWMHHIITLVSGHFKL